MKRLDEIENLTLKRTAIESVLTNCFDREMIADRIIMMLDDNSDKLEMLISGIPYEFLDEKEENDAEEYIKTRIDNLIKINSISIDDFNIKVDYDYNAVRYIRPGDEEAKSILMSGRYCSESSYWKHDEYTEEITCPATTSTVCPISEFQKAGIQFKKI